MVMSEPVPEATPENAAADGGEEIHFPCESCGATLAFAPGTRSIRCGHCGHENAISEDGPAIEEIDLEATLATLQREAPHTAERVVRCASCGAEFTLAKDAHAGACPYCGSSVVTDTGKERPIKPAGLVPFQLTEEQARERLAGWLKSLWFAPSGVAQFARSDGRLTGVYAPHWTFDAATASKYTGERGVFVQVPRTRTVMVNGKPRMRTVMVTETRWTRVRGFVSRAFDDVLVLASRNLPQHLAGRLRDWRLAQLAPYREEYLAGFRSEAYQVELDEGFVLARQAMEAQIRQDVMRDIGGNVQRVHQVDTKYGKLSFKHVLLPIWIAAYRYSGKPYQFVVNGQTGEVAGERPWSKLKIALAVLGAAVVAAAVWYFTQQQG